jgi:hypothetical protein
VVWDVEVTDEFKAWWSGLTEAEHISVERAVLLLEERGPHLPFPYSSGDDRWYERNVPLADQIYDNYLAEMEEEDNAKDDKVQ